MKRREAHEANLESLQELHQEEPEDTNRKASVIRARVHIIGQVKTKGYGKE
jgi:hypothetical protein